MKIIKININDIILDSKNVSSIINNNCFEKADKKNVTGAYLKGDNLIVWLEPVINTNEINISEYVVAQLNDPSEASMIAEIQSRYEYGFSTITFFEIHDKLWGIFARLKYILKTI